MLVNTSPLEQKYRAGFVLYPSLGEVSAFLKREFKLCEWCGFFFVRLVMLRKDSDGILRSVGTKKCMACKARHEVAVDSVKQNLELEIKAETQRYRRRGADHPADIEPKVNRSWAAWRTKVEAAMRERGGLTHREIGELCGCDGHYAIQNCERVGLNLRVVGKRAWASQAKNRTYMLNLYALAVIQ